MGDSSDDSDLKYYCNEQGVYYLDGYICDGCERDVDGDEKVWRFKDNLPIDTEEGVGFDLCTECGPKRWLEGSTVEYEQCCSDCAECLRCGAGFPNGAWKSVQVRLEETVILFTLCDSCSQQWGASPPLDQYMQLCDQVDVKEAARHIEEFGNCASMRK